MTDWPVTYDANDTWYADVDAPSSGTTAVTVTDLATGETASVQVTGGDTGDATFALTAALTSDASAGHVGATALGAMSSAFAADAAPFQQGYLLARNASLGRTYLAGPYALIPYPSGDAGFAAGHVFSADAISAQVGALALGVQLSVTSDAVSVQPAAATLAALLAFDPDAVFLGSLAGSTTLAQALAFASDATLGHVVDLTLGGAFAVASDAGYQAPLSAAGASSLDAAFADGRDAVYRGPDLVSDQAISLLVAYDSDALFGPRYDADESLDAIFGVSADAAFAGIPPVVYPPIICALADLTLIAEIADQTYVTRLPDLTFIADSADDSEG